MSHFGVISPPVSGHINPFLALAGELQSRGHRVTFFQVADLESKVRTEGVGFWQIGESDHPAGSLPESLAQLARLKGLAALRFTIRAVARTSVMTCRDAPDAVRAAGIDALLVDQMEPAGGAVAERAGLPFVTVCNALAINRDPVAPPPFSPWRYRDRFWAPWRNAAGYAISDRLTRPVTEAVAGYRRQWGLPAHRTPDESFSPLAQICQMPKEFDFPRRMLPAAFHYVGPIRRTASSPYPFPWDRLDGRPLVYCSLGTLQNRREALFRTVAEACMGLDVQLVVSHGGGLSDEQAAGLPGSPLVVPYAPQVELLRRAALTITHAGLNTVLDSLSQSVPLVAIPITYEQPAIARRVERTGAGRSVALEGVTSQKLRTLVTEVLGNGAYRQAAGRLAGAIREGGGAARAAAIVEDVLKARPAVV